jgi:type I restriction enzyme S subunit
VTSTLKSLEASVKNGVDFKRTGDLAEVGTGSSNKNQSTEDGQFPFYVRSKEVYRINSYEYDETAIVIPGEGGVGEIFHFVEGKYALHQRAYRIKFNASVILPKFAYFYFRTHFKEFIKIKSLGGTVTSIRKPMIEDFLIPVLPLTIQQKIVETLSMFIELDEELNQELGQRERQYKKYSDDFFSNLDDSNSKLVDFSDAAGIFDGVHQTPTYTSEGVKFVSVENIGALSNSSKFVSPADYEKNYRVKPIKGDLLMTRIGSVGKCAVIDIDEPLAYYVSLALIKPKKDMVTSSYLKHYLESHAGKLELDKRTLHHAVPLKINLGDIGKIKLRLPSLEVQHKITNVLDLFAELMSSPTGGLQTEISARKRQFEYYRNNLLTFSDLEKK